SILFGLLGFIGTFYSAQFHYENVNINIVWSLIFPLIVAMIWGRRYGCISITLGLTALYPFYLGGYNGWANLVPSFSLFLWVMLLGYGAEKQLQDKKFYYNIYFLQSIYILIRVILYFTVFPWLYQFNPPLWYPAAHTTIEYKIILTFAVKNGIFDCILFAICDVLLLLPFIKKIFKLECPKTSRYNTGVVLSVTATGILFTLIVLIFNYYIIDRISSFQWLLNPSSNILM
ncbi:MAG: two-component sensor histidine kinase, partial [Anaerovorax sp.]